MKYDDMNYSNNDWKSDRGLLSEAYEDLYKVYAEKNRRDRQAQLDKEDQEKWKKKEKDQKERDMADVQELPAGYEGHKVRHHSDVKEEDSCGEQEESKKYEEGAENVRREGDVLEKKELLLGDDEDEEDDDEQEESKKYEESDNDNDEDDDDRDLRDVWKKTQDEEEAEKKKKKRDEMKMKVAQAVSSNYDEFGLGTFEEKTREITLNELWAISGTGEEIWTESGDSTNEMKTKVGDTVYFTWNYRPNDKDSCRSLCRAKIVS